VGVKSASSIGGSLTVDWWFRRTDGDWSRCKTVKHQSIWPTKSFPEQPLATPEVAIMVASQQIKRWQPGFASKDAKEPSCVLIVWKGVDSHRGESYPSDHPVWVTDLSELCAARDDHSVSMENVSQAESNSISIPLIEWTLEATTTRWGSRRLQEISGVGNKGIQG